MARWLLWRLAGCAVALWLIATLAFLMVRAAPGGPFGSDQPLPPKVLANLQRTFGLAKAVPNPVAGQPPLIQPTTTLEQYTATLASYARLDFGATFASQGERTVAETVAATFPVSLELGIYALVLALVFGVGLGWLGALWPGRWVDHLTRTAALLVVALGTLVLAPLLLWMFGVQWRVLPWGGWVPWSLAPHDMAPKILPVLTLALVYGAWVARLARAGMVDVLQQPWIAHAKANGLSPLRIVLVHAARPALLPVVSYLGPAVAGVVTGSVVVERVFAVPGIGQSFVVAALNRDYPLVLGTVLLYAALLLACNLAVDVAYVWLDPKQRTAGQP